MRPRDRATGLALAVVLMAGLVWASNAPMTTNAIPDPRLRLAWSARPERIERCRQQSAEELARVPAHMRQAVACEGTTAEYRLQVRVADALVTDRVVHGGGLRRDRRLYVFEEIVVPAGGAAVDVRFDRVDPDEPGGTGDARERDRATLTPAQRDEVPAHLSFAQRIDLSPRSVMLVTYDAERQALVTALGPPPAAR